MRFWPFNLEARAQGLSDRIIQFALSQAQGNTATAQASAVGALEAASGFLGRAFSSADVVATGAAVDVLSPACLGLIGRQLIRRGELVLLVSTEGGRLSLLPASSYSVTGGPDPESWRYEVTIGGPSETLTHYGVPSAGVIHVRYAVDPADPWRGVGPLQVAALAGRLSAETSAALADESSGPRGSFLSVPIGGDSPAVSALKKDIRAAKGDLLLGKGGSWDQGPEGMNSANYRAQRFGANPPASMVDLADLASREVLSACGVPAVLFSDRGDGSALRESYRRVLHTTVAPLGKLVARELSDKLETAVAFDWQELRAGDIASRARAFGTLVKGGMALEQAAALSGLLMIEQAS